MPILELFSGYFPSPAYYSQGADWQDGRWRCLVAVMFMEQAAHKQRRLYRSSRKLLHFIHLGTWAVHGLERSRLQNRTWRRLLEETQPMTIRKRFSFVAVTGAIAITCERMTQTRCSLIAWTLVLGSSQWSLRSSSRKRYQAMLCAIKTEDKNALQALHVICPDVGGDEGACLWFGILALPGQTAKEYVISHYQ